MKMDGGPDLAFSFLGRLLALVKHVVTPLRVSAAFISDRLRFSISRSYSLMQMTTMSIALTAVFRLEFCCENSSISLGNGQAKALFRVTFVAKD